MSADETPRVGTIGWQDLTVPNAEAVRDFYQTVVGWKTEPVDMGEYSDFSLIPPDGSSGVAGICHARGSNADIPPQWLLYFVVEDLEASVAATEKGGGEVVVAPRGLAGGRFCVIRDPAGAVCALWQR